MKPIYAVHFLNPGWPHGNYFDDVTHIKKSLKYYCIRHNYTIDFFMYAITNETNKLNIIDLKFFDHPLDCLKKTPVIFFRLSNTDTKKIEQGFIEEIIITNELREILK